MTGPPADNSINLDCAVADNPVLLPSYGFRPTLPPNITPSDTEIAVTGASGVYLPQKASCANINPATLQVVVGTAGGLPHCSSASCDVNLPIPVTKGHIMPKFHHNLIGIVPLCDHGCRILFEEHLLLFLPKTTQSYYMDGVNPLEPSCRCFPSAPKIILWYYQNGALSQQKSMHMTCQVWEPLSDIYTQPRDSK